MLSPRNLGD